jgi:hypothetical protein
MEQETESMPDVSLPFFGELARRYWHDAFAFVLVHGVVLVSVFSSLMGIIRETQALRNWSVNGPEGGSEVVSALGQFVKESRQLGPQGMFVPMTDFSDRLDALVEGRVGELYDRISLFLLVGIAGTLFGLFEFAVRAVGILNRGSSPEIRIADLGRALSEGLAKAFPVAFVGLVLMLLFQLLASFPERRLRSALAGATRRALDVRRTVSISQVAIVDRAAERIEVALRPLLGLQDFLADSLAPVIGVLGERLDASLALVKVQFTELEKTTSGFGGAVGVLGSTVKSLASRTETLATLIERAPAILERIGEAQVRQEVASIQREANLLQSLEATQKVAAALETVTREVGGLPAQLVAITDKGVDEAVRGASDAWLEMAQTLRQALDGEMRRLSELATAQLGNIERAGVDAAGALQKLTAQGATAAAGWEGLSVRVGAQLKETFDAIEEGSARTWKNTTKDLINAAQEDLLRFSDQLAQDSRKVSESMASAGIEWERLALNAQSLLSEPLREAAQALRTEITSGFDEILSKYPEAASQVEKLTRELVGLIARVEQVRRSFEVSQAAATQRPAPKREEDSSAKLLQDIFAQMKADFQVRDQELHEVHRNISQLDRGIREIENRGFWRGLFRGRR